MASSNNHETISRASLHTQKKFELIEKYIMPWAQKLMNNSNCKGLVFIDCMCNTRRAFSLSLERCLAM